MPLYGYHWTKGKPGVGVSYANAMRNARRDGITLTRDSATRTIRGASGNGGSAIWLTDAVLLDELMQGAEKLGVTRFAFWRLGQEDPAVWSKVSR